MCIIIHKSETDNLIKNEISDLLGIPSLIPGVIPLTPFPSPESPGIPDEKSKTQETDDEAVSSRLSVADIFHLYWEDYRKENSVTNQQIKTAYDIMNCRTGYYGYNINMCDTCGHTEIFANS